VLLTKFKNMGTLKEVNARRKLIKETIGKVEKILNVSNGHWNNMLKTYQFEFGEKGIDHTIDTIIHSLKNSKKTIKDLLKSHFLVRLFLCIK
jgi:plasmid maintenance system antidote protein VapI